jgi:hypothetical protein
MEDIRRRKLGWLRMMKWKGSDRKRLWCNPGYILTFAWRYSGKPEKENLGQVSQDQEAVPSEYKFITLPPDRPSLYLLSRHTFFQSYRCITDVSKEHVAYICRIEE